MNHIEKYITKKNTTSDNITYLVNIKNILCQNNKLHPLTARRGKLISETIYRDIEKSFNMTHINTSFQKEEIVYLIRNGLMVRLNMICFDAQIALNRCVQKFKIKLMLLGNYIYLSKR